MKKELLKELEDKGFKLVGINGFSEMAVIGFSSHEQANEFAKEHNSELSQLSQRAGEHSWHLDGDVLGNGLNISANDYGPNYSSYTNETEEYEVVDKCKATLDIAESMEEVAIAVAFFSRLWNDIQALKDDQQLIVEDLPYSEDYYAFVIDKEPLDWYDEKNSKYYRVGVLVEY